jgi:hypothetical protein
MRPGNTVRLVLLAVVLAPTVYAQGPGPAKVITRGTAQPDIKTDRNFVNARGTNAVFTRAGDVRNGMISVAKPVDIPIEEQMVINGKTFTTKMPGKGNKDVDKYKRDPKTKGLIPQEDTVSGSSMGGKAPDVTDSEATASWESFVGARSSRIELSAEGKVAPATKNSPPGLAAAESKDPFVFNMTSSGSLGFDFVVGSSTIVTDPNTRLPQSPLEILCNDSTGRAHLDFSAGMTGVRINGQPLNGDLFVLSVDAQSPVRSPSDLTINFLPFAGLGLTSSDVAAFDSYFRSQLTTLPDGSVGLRPGQEFALIGSGSPIPTVTADFDPGTVTIFDSTTAVGAIAPEPSGAVLALVGAGALVAVVFYRRVGGGVASWPLSRRRV